MTDYHLLSTIDLWKLYGEIGFYLLTRIWPAAICIIVVGFYWMDTLYGDSIIKRVFVAFATLLKKVFVGHGK